MSTTLYERLGGRESIDAVVEEFYDRVLSDDRVIHFFEDADTSSLRTHQAQFIASVTGGPVEYDGDDMAAAHAHLDIDGRDFRIIANHLNDALEEYDVPEQERREVITAVGELEPAIVSE